MPRLSSPSRTATERLRELIRTGAFRQERLASEPAIAAMLGVSRPTVRQALAELAHEGMIIRKHGSGTFLNRHILQLRTRLEEVWDFAEMIERAGYTPGVKHIRTELRPANDVERDKLQLEAGSQVLSVTNLFLANRRPVIYCRDVIPGGLVRQAYAPEELHGPIYTFLAQRCQQRVIYNITEILPVAANTLLARYLKCKRGTPLHYFQEVGFNAEHTPIMYSEEYYWPEAFSFQLVRKMTWARVATTASAPKTGR